MAGQPNTDIRNEPKVDANDVLDVEALALKTGITGDQAQDLIDRFGTDRQLLETAARELKRTG